MSMKQLKYCPELNAFTGGVTATLVLLQLEYWFNKIQNKTFYKFLDVCNHDLYKTGDSWVEELGFTKCEFRNAFSKIGKAYKSKKAFRLSQDLFGGKYYASYYDRKKGLTYYIRNTMALEKLFKPETSQQESLSSDSKKSISSSTPVQNIAKPTSVNTKTQSPLSVDYNKRLTTVKNTYTPKESVPYATIQQLFNQTCPSFPQLSVLTPKRKTMLQKLWHGMGQTLENFKKAFSLAEASDFLSGRIGSWRASFDWLIQEDTFVALLEGAYTNPNIKKPSPNPSAVMAPPTSRSTAKFTTMYAHNWDYEELEKLEEQYIDRQLTNLAAL